MRLPRTLTDILCTYYSFVSCARFQHYVSLNLSWQGKRNSLASRQLGASSSDHGSPMWSHYSSRTPSDTFRTAPSDKFVHVKCSLLSYLRHPHISIHTLYMLSSIEHSFISSHSYFIFFLLFVTVIRLLRDSRFHTSSKPPFV